MFTLRQLKEFDTLVLEDEQRLAIGRECRELGEDFLFPLNPILNEGVIKIITEEYLVFNYFKTEDGLAFEFDMYMYNRKTYSFKRTVQCTYHYITKEGDLIYPTLLHIEAGSEAGSEYAKTVQEARDYSIGLSGALLSYLSYKSLGSEVKHVTAKEKKRGKSSSSKSSGKREVIISNVRVLYTKGNINIGGRKYEGSWTVRGHYRHLSSGKTVFVKAHKKGEDAHKPKNYKTSASSPRDADNVIGM